jgi:hypothetical protein
MKLDFEKWNLLNIVFYIILGYHAWANVLNTYLYLQDGFENWINIYNILLIIYLIIWGFICKRNAAAYYIYLGIMAISLVSYFVLKSGGTAQPYLAFFPANVLFSLVLLINYKAYFNKK